MSYMYRFNSNFKEIMGGESGLTLIEMLIAVAFTGVVLMIASTMIIQSFDIFFGGTERMTASQMAEMAVSQIANDIRASDEVDGNCVEDNSDDPIEITIDKHDDDDDEIVTYVYIDETIVREDNNDDTRTIAHNVDELCVNEINDHRYEITLTYVDRDGVKKDRSTTVRRRNVDDDD